MKLTGRARSRYEAKARMMKARKKFAKKNKKKKDEEPEKE